MSTKSAPLKCKAPLKCDGISLNYTLLNVKVCIFQTMMIKLYSVHKSLDFFFMHASAMNNSCLARAHVSSVTHSRVELHAHMMNPSA